MPVRAPIHIQEQIEKHFKSMEGWCTVEKALLLVGLILEHRPKYCVESGIFGARSFIAQGLALQELGKEHVIFGADPWEIEPALEGDIGKENADWWRNHVDLETIYVGAIHWICTFKMTWHCRWIRAKSNVVARMFDDGAVDWFHQDSNHSEKVSTEEVATWGPKMAPRSIWILDDSDWPTQAKAIAMIEALGYTRLADEKTFIVFKR